MEELIYNPYKARLETISVIYNDKNTTWFEDCSEPEDIYRLTDMTSGLLIKKNDYGYPVVVYNVTRESIGNDAQKAKELLDMCLEELLP